MTSIEQTGKSVEEATQLALQRLGVTEEEVVVEILDEGSKGFLGLGQTPAVVRVTLRERPAREATEASGEEEVSLPTSTAYEDIGEPETPEANNTEPEDETVLFTEPSADEAISSEDIVQKAAEISREMLQHIVEIMGDGARVSVKSAEDRQVVLDIVGGNTALLIGKHGQTINALQYLVGIATNKRLPGQIRIILDAEGYRQRREHMLREHALHLAEKVKETGQEAVLDPLEAFERRIVHLALANDPEVYTYSEGEEPDRRVVISPKK